jgi:hypothetical protein
MAQKPTVHPVRAGDVKAGLPWTVQAAPTRDATWGWRGHSRTSVASLVRTLPGVLGMDYLPVSALVRAIVMRPRCATVSYSFA